MKVYSSLLSLCVLSTNVWGTNAFFVQSPKRMSLTVHQSSSAGSNQQDPSGSFSAPGGPGFDSSTGGSLAAPGGGALEPGHLQRAKQSWESTLSETIVQGGSLKTWSFPTSDLERVAVALNTEGRQLKASISLCQGPDNTPQRMDVTIGKGMLRPFRVIIETPGDSSTVFVRNMSPLEFPFTARVGAQMTTGMQDAIGSAEPSDAMLELPASIYDMSAAKIVQGGAIYSYAFDGTAESAKVILKTDGRPLNARVELIQGPNSNKEVIELYTEDGLERPFFTIITMPGVGNVIRIVNTATVEFPLIACVEPFEFTPGTEPDGPPDLQGVETGGLILDR